MLESESWLAGSIFWSSSPGKGKLEGKEIVDMLGMVVVAGQEAWLSSPCSTPPLTNHVTYSKKKLQPSQFGLSMAIAI